ncbi:MAG TPA: N-acetylmuramoyl-L-alanine amidase, partial [Armatimonadota bacterium]|nr:N-acetylmuramoyl-L-alanine amidase [Armatimonadota bacterium]
KEPSREIKVAIGTSEPKESQKTGNTTPVTPVNITNVKVDPDGDSRIRVRIWTSGKATFSTSMLSNPSRVVVDIQKGNIAMSKEDMELDHPILKRVRFGQQDSASRIVFDVSRYVLVAGDADPNGINLSLQLPKGAGGKLADKTIVIDPGHGGRDPGAQRNGVQEKTLNLQISNAIRYALEREGAKVILTRYDDQFLELSDRPAVADQYRADFFISVHCNAMPSPNTATGIQTLYSNKSGSNYLLAAALHNQIVRLTGMSDGKVRNRPGLIVLKHANIPAVLLECGFIDNDRDRQKLCDPTYHRTLAQAVVDGLKHYVEGTTESEGN